MLAVRLISIVPERFERNHESDVVAAPPCGAGVDHAALLFREKKRRLFIGKGDETDRPGTIHGGKSA